MLVVLAVGLVVLAVWWLGFRSSGGPAGGPLVGKADGSLGGPVKPGVPISIAMLELTNGGSSDIVVDRVALVDPTTGMRLVGMYAEPADVGSLGFGGPFRWPRGALEVEGLTISSGADPGYRLVLGVQIDAQGIHRSPGVRVEYHSGGSTYVKSFRSEVTLCAPPRLFRARCS